MMTFARGWLHAAAARLGVDLVRYASPRHPVGRRMRLIRYLGIDLVLDVGANIGQFGRELRRHGYPGRIVSFEPLAAPFARLSGAASRDPLWDVVRCGIADADGPARMHIAANGGASSSLLAATSLHERAAPGAQQVDVEEVQLRRLDDVAADAVGRATSTYLKVDVQGAERRVLDGAIGLLPKLAAVQLELSLEPLYVDGPLYDELIHLMGGHGFRLAGLEPGFTDPSDGRLLQVDALFVLDDARVAGRRPSLLEAT